MAKSSNLELIRLAESEMLNVMSNTERCDKDLAESAVKRLYISSGNKPPEIFFWFQSLLDAVPAAMLCAWVESARLQLNNEHSQVVATVKANDAILSEPERRSTSAPPAVPHDQLFPLTARWKGWLFNLDLLEDSICLARTILRNPPPRELEPVIYRNEVNRLRISAAIIRRAVDRSSRRYLTYQFAQKSPSQLFTETSDYLSNATTNSRFLEELNRACTVVSRLTEREQRFVHECLVNFIYSAQGIHSNERLKFRHGQHDADFASELLFPKLLGADVYRAEEILDVTRTCGWWCPFTNVCIMVDRPTEIHFDHRGMLHNTEGPSCMYEDGLGFFSLRGVSVPQWIAEGNFDRQKIEVELNAEFRRVMIDRYGVERYLQESNASLVSEDQCGRLFRISLGKGEQPLMMVEVRNSTPEPDGSHKLYFLRVPPNMTTARDAVAWTFSMENDYNPAIQS